MDEDEYYVIQNLTKFVNSSRKIVFTAFGVSDESFQDDLFKEIDDLAKEELEEMEEVLSLKESMAIAKSYVHFQVNKKTKKQRMVLKGSDFNEFIEALNARLVSNLLMSLVKKGIIETAYDPEENDFIFWTKDESEKKDEDS